MAEGDVRAGLAPEFRLETYDYPLDPAAIAQHPAEERHQARLLKLRRADGAIELGHVPDLFPELGPGDCLVRNATRVEKARLRGRKLATGGKVEVLLLEVTGPGRRKAFLKPSKKTRPGTEVDFGGVVATIGEAFPDGSREVAFVGEPALARAVEAAGELPLPPYVRPADQDPSRYQTTYAREGGSVAAPTAGLHFEAADFADLEDRGVEVVDVFLDVGAGTFAPIREPDVRDHPMHAERFRIEPEQAARLAAARAAGSRVVALGTTAMRVLESLPGHPGWEGGLEASTELYVTPGHEFRVVQALVTNFHLPRSSLLVLVSAFAGVEAIRRAYARARDEGFRFFSFGDCMWIR